VSPCCSSLDSGKYEVDKDGLVVYGVTFADSGRYECIGNGVTVGNTLTEEIIVEVISE